MGLNDVVPQAAQRYRSLPLLGSHVGEFITWMSARGYRETTLYDMLIMLPRIDRWLRAHGVEQLAEIDPAVLGQCWKERAHRQCQAGTVILDYLRQARPSGVDSPVRT